jgi:signal transduction histidine kinase
VRFAVQGCTARLEVTDDGVGFEVGADIDTGADAVADSSSGYGMRSMAERAELVGGDLTVISQPGAGTTIVATVSIN